MKLKTSPLPLLTFFLLGIIWGSNFIYMKLASSFISPTQIVICRVLFGFIPVLVFAILKSALSWQHLRHARHFLIMSLLATTIYCYGFAKGSALLLSGVAGALSGSIPLFSFVLGVIFIAEEQINRMKLLGVLVAFVGVMLMGRPSGGELLATNLEGLLYIVGGSLSLGASFVYAKRYLSPLKIPAVALVTYQLGFGLLILTLITNFSGMEDILAERHALFGLVVGLGLLGTGIAYILYYYLIEKLGAISASTVTYLPPVVALLIGSFIVGEPLGIIDYAATGLIFTGVVLLKRQ